MLLSMCFTTANIFRQSAKGVSSTTVASSITISNQPKVRTGVTFVFGQKVTGSLVLTGTLSGASISETITVSDNKVAMGTKQFDSLSGVTISAGIVATSTTVEVKYSGAAGGSVPIETQIVDNWPIRVSRNSANYGMPRQGSVELEGFKALIPYDTTWNPQEFDIVIIKETNEKFIVAGSVFIEQVGINKHWVANLRRYERE